MFTFLNTYNNSTGGSQRAGIGFSGELLESVKSPEERELILDLLWIWGLRIGGSDKIQNYHSWKFSRIAGPELADCDVRLAEDTSSTLHPLYICSYYMCKPVYWDEWTFIIQSCLKISFSIWQSVTSWGQCYVHIVILLSAQIQIHKLYCQRSQPSYANSYLWK